MIRKILEPKNIKPTELQDCVESKLTISNYSNQITAKAILGQSDSIERMGKDFI